MDKTEAHIKLVDHEKDKAPTKDFVLLFRD